jgi:hypothetical protein
MSGRRFSRTLAARPPRRGRAAWLIAAALLAPAARAHGPDELGEPPLPFLSPVESIAGLGPSGTRPMPPAKPGQTLPLRPARTIRFDTDQGTALSIDLSPDGRTIAFDMLGDIYLLDAEGGRARAITRGMAFDSQPAFSPDGRHILFLSDRSGAENLWIMDADGSHPRQVSFYDDNPVFVSPAWSADGTSAYVTRFWPDRNAYEMWRFTLDGGDPMGSVFLPNWTDAQQQGEKTSSLGAAPSPDGRFLYYAAHGGTIAFESPSEWQIARRDLATGKTDVLLKAVGDIRLGPVQSSAFRPVLSHDGRLLAYGVRRVGKTWLRIRDLDSGADRTLAEIDHDELQSSFWSDIIPHFAFTRDDKALIVGTGGGIRRIAIATGEARPIAFTATVERQLGPLVRNPVKQETGPVRARLIQTPALSPDGGMLAFSALTHLYAMPVGGAAPPQRLDDGDMPSFHPSWSPDGRSLTYVSWTAQEGGAIWVKAIGGEARKLTARHAFYTHPVFTPDGRAILAVRSPDADRLNSYVEFGQLRDADLVLIPLDGSAAPRVVATGRIGGTPHFGPEPGSLYLNEADGVHAIGYGVQASDRLTVQAVGPGWYFSQGAAAADDLRVSPDGKWVLAQGAQQLHLFAMPEKAGETVNLSAPSVAHRRLTDVGADFFGWADGGRTIWWSVGSTFYRRALAGVALERPGIRPGPTDAPQDAGGPVHARDVAVTVPRDTPRGTLLLRGATAITMRGDEVIPNVDILIVDDHIAAVGAAGSVAVPANAAVRRLDGAWIVPGFIDTHDHIADIRRDVLDLRNWGPAASLAYGVTTTFDPSSLTIDMLPYQDLVDSGQMTGSRIATTGPAIFSFNDFQSKAEVEAVLRRYRDHYRLRNLKQYRAGNRRVRQWFIEAARELGMTPTNEGALSRKLDLTHIIDGYAGNEHSIPPVHLHDDILTFFAQSGTSSTLTLQITHGGAPAQDYFITRAAPHDDPKYARFAPGWFRDQKFWQRDWHDAGEYVFADVARSAARFQRLGGVLGIGAHGEVPGLGTHWEMQAHAMGGMTPMAVLHAATIQGATTIGHDAEFGSIEAGKYADLVILDRNPLEDIRNTLAIRQVMKNGRLYDGDTLAELWPRQRPMAPFWFTNEGTGPPAAR